MGTEIKEGALMKSWKFMTLMGVLLMAASPTLATETATVVAGNPTCQELGYAYEAKSDSGASATVNLVVAGQDVGDATATSDGTNFDWTATIPIDAVIVKGGDQANVYTYVPEAVGGFGLHPPGNASGGVAAISHISFCFDLEVAVSKNATTRFTRTFDWSIAKTASVANMQLRPGDKGAIDYTITPSSVATDSDWAVSGQVKIANPWPLPATVTGVTDRMESVPIALDCGATYPLELAPGQTVSCTYAQALPNGVGGINTATVATAGVIGGGSATAPVVFDEPTLEIDKCVALTDSLKGSLGQVCAGAAPISYRLEVGPYACGSYKKDNSATLVSSKGEQTAVWSVEILVPCVTVSKNANTSFTRQYDWMIEKSADQQALMLSPGQQFLANYQVLVGIAGEVDSDWRAWGKIQVANPAGNPVAHVVEVLDQMDGGAVTVSCGSDLPFDLGAGLNHECAYSASLPDGSTRINTATANTTGVVGGGSGTAMVSFEGAAMSQVDECVEVTDTNLAASLGTVCLGQAPVSLHYSLAVGPYSQCGEYEVPNLARLLSNDTQVVREAAWTISVDIPCGGGCTLTPGYWKTHSEHGPAPYDDTWAKLGGADTPFYYSGQSYYQVLWTPPQNGNTYYILAHAYIAAQMNALNGAAVNDVQVYLDAAEVYFDNPAITPATVGAAKGKDKTLRADMIFIAGQLDAYNNGLTGPGHCTEDGLSAK